KRPAPGANPAQPWFNQKADRKLPWGHTEDVAPQSYRTDYSPSTLRRFEKEPNHFANIDFHQRIDHERYRHAKAALRTQILLFLSGFGNPIIIGFVAIPIDRKSTRLNSSHVKISYAVFCLKKKKYVKQL